MSDKDPQIEILDQIFKDVPDAVQAATEAPIEEVLIIHVMTNLRPQYVRIATTLKTYEKFGPAVLAHVALGIFKVTGVTHQPPPNEHPHQDEQPRD